MGPGGAIAVLCAVIFFLWRLFREAESDSKAHLELVSGLAKAVENLTIEVRAWREAAKK